jgi:hypothetical protein
MTDDKLIDEIQAQNGIKNINDPELIFVTLAEDRISEKSSGAIKRRLRTVDSLDTQPTVIPERVTIKNLRKQLYFEDQIRKFRREFENLTGKHVDLDWSRIGEYSE